MFFLCVIILYSENVALRDMNFMDFSLGVVGDAGFVVGQEVFVFYMETGGKMKVLGFIRDKVG